jgi:3-oxoacyl-[acyl-carrier-protein] synthase-3
MEVTEMVLQKKIVSLLQRMQGNQKSNLHLSMEGPKVLDFTLREIALSIEELLKQSKVSQRGY